jgi:hypothetical protein
MSVIMRFDLASYLGVGISSYVMPIIGIMLKIDKQRDRIIFFMFLVFEMNNC